MSTARYLIGDVHERQAELEPGSYDLIITSPPFLALRSYLPDGHPDKDREIGSEPTPAAFLDVLLDLTAGWGRLLAPHGSIAVEIGDTYAGSGGAGGDYNPDGLREGQARFDGSAARRGPVKASPDQQSHRDMGEGTVAITGGDGWPLAKSLAMIPELYAASLAYGRNLLTGQPSPAGRWRVRNFKPWIRSNPPVGALGDKERPATSYVTVATRAAVRYFDLDAVRHPHSPHGGNHTVNSKAGVNGYSGFGRDVVDRVEHPAGAPPLDWWHHVDAIIDAEIDRRAGKTGQGGGAGPGRRSKLHGGSEGDGPVDKAATTVGARGVHVRRALEAAGILTTVDALDVSPKGYKGAHYAVWPPELVKRLLQEMTPRRVCTTCGEPSRRIVETTQKSTGRTTNGREPRDRSESYAGTTYEARTAAVVETLGWSDCGHDTWRPGRILDPFAGSGTTLAVATGLGHHADGIDLDQRNAILALDRVGIFLDIIWPAPDHTLPALPSGGGDYRPWLTDQQAEHLLAAVTAAMHTGTRRRQPARRTNGKAPAVLDGQLNMLTEATA